MIRAELEQGSFSFRSFYVRRARRLFPALVFTVLASFVAAALLFSPEELKAFSLSLIAATTSLSNILFWSQAGYFDAASNMKPLLHTWSLGVEEQFYLIWPACMFLLARWKLSTPLALLIAFVLSLASNYIWQDHTSSIFYLLPFRIFEFAIGGGIVWLQHARRSNLAKEAMTICGVALIVASYVLFSSSTPFPSFPALLPCIGAALTIMGGTSRFSGAALGSRIPAAIGVRSYSIYLAHWPIIVFYEYCIEDSIGLKDVIPLLVVTLLISSAMYSFIETPFRKKSNGDFSILKDRFAASAAAVAVVLIAISASAWSTGWLWRLAPDSAKFVAKIGDVSSFKSTAFGGYGCSNVCNTHPGKPTLIYLIGDSHAQHYFYGFKSVFPDFNTRIFTFSSCPFYSEEYTRNFSDYSDPALYDHGCRAARDAAFAEIRDTNALLVVSQYWINFPLISERTGRTINASDMVGAATVISRELEKMKHDLKLSNIAVLGNSPGALQGETFTDCMTRPATFRRDCAKTVSTTDYIRSIMIETNKDIGPRLAGVATFLNPFDALCDQSSCRLTSSDGMPLYRDDTHLTKWGSELIVQVFRHQIESLLPSAPRQSAKRSEDRTAPN
jgi:peptidoglycan/LPS O-acetylase OafA/YrhL